MLRFALSPDGTVVPDLKRKLPGRGVWVTADHASVAAAVRKRAFARAFRRDVTVDPALADQVAALMRAAALERLSLAHKAGCVVGGYEKLRTAVEKGPLAGILTASDAAPDALRRGEALANKAANLHNTVKRVTVFSSAELESTLGRDRVVHAALTPGRLSDLFFSDASRMRTYCSGDTHDGTHPPTDEPRFAG